MWILYTSVVQVCSTYCCPTNIFLPHLWLAQYAFQKLFSLCEDSLPLLKRLLSKWILVVPYKFGLTLLFKDPEELLNNGPFVLLFHRGLVKLFQKTVGRLWPHIRIDVIKFWGSGMLQHATHGVSHVSSLFVELPLDGKTLEKSKVSLGNLIKQIPILDVY